MNELDLLKESILEEKETEFNAPIVLKGQYKEAIEIMQDAEVAGLPIGIVGPPGVGKTLLARYFASQLKRNFYWITLDESTKPAHLVGGFDPAIVLKQGYSLEAYMPGPLLRAMISGGVFFANEINRATEYTQNIFLEPLEEGSIYLPKIGRVKAQDGFFFIAAMNPTEMIGTHRISEALRDRIKVWISLDFPDKSTELQIIRSHCPEMTDENVLEYIHRIISLTREHEEIENPASIRTGIALAKMWSISNKKSLDDFFDIAWSILQGAIKPRTGIDAKLLAEQIITDAMNFEGDNKK